MGSMDGFAAGTGSWRCWTGLALCILEVLVDGRGFVGRCVAVGVVMVVLVLPEEERLLFLFCEIVMVVGVVVAATDRFSMVG
jgi:hypothetical protein